MNKTNYFIECLELMDWTVKPSGLCPGEWLVYKIDSHEHLTAQQIEDKARKELIKRDGVMERVVEWWNKRDSLKMAIRYVIHGPGQIFDESDPVDGCPMINPVELVEDAINNGITPRELMGISG